MSRRARVLAVVVALAATAALANRFGSLLTVMGGLQLGRAATVGTAANKVTTMLGGSATIDFVAGTIVCTDSSAITVTGAAAGDACFVGMPATNEANSTFTCYVSAANAVKVRHCPAGTAADPASATYYVRTISSQ